MDSSGGWFAAQWANETDLGRRASWRVGRCPVATFATAAGFPASVAFQRLSDKRRLALTEAGAAAARGVQRILARARDDILRRNQRARLRKRPTVLPPCRAGDRQAILRPRNARKITHLEQQGGSEILERASP